MDLLKGGKTVKHSTDGMSAVTTGRVRPVIEFLGRLGRALFVVGQLFSLLLTGLEYCTGEADGDELGTSVAGVADDVNDGLAIRFSTVQTYVIYNGNG